MGNGKVGEVMALIGLCQVDQNIDFSLFEFIENLAERGDAQLVVQTRLGGHGAPQFNGKSAGIFTRQAGGERRKVLLATDDQGVFLCL